MASTKRKRLTKKPAPNRMRAVKLYSQPEAKYAINRYQQNMLSGTLYAFNLNYFLPQGIQRYALIGTKGFLKSIYLRFQATIVNNSNTQFESPQMRLLVIKTTQSLTTTSAIVSSSAIFRNDGSASSAFVSGGAHVDRDIHTLMWDYQPPHVYPCNNQTSATQLQAFNKKLVINKPFQTEGNNSGVWKDGQYYLIACFDKPGDTGITTGVTLSVQYGLTYYDQ